MTAYATNGSPHATHTAPAVGLASEDIAAADWRSQLDAMIEVALTDPLSPLSPAAVRVATAGGKRLRGEMVLRAAMAVDASISEASVHRLLSAAVSIELLHAGSLVHDDILDEALTRRGVVTINARDSNTWAVLAGDMILARGSLLSARLGQREAQLYGELLDTLCFGQALESQTVGDLGRNEPAYLAAIGGKTAALIEGACRIGGMQVTADEDELAVLTTFGRNFGMAFQVIDDIFDVVLTDEELGKPSMQDVRERVYTYPVIKGLEQGGTLGATLAAVARGTVDAETARSAICASGGVEAAWEAAASYSDAARSALLESGLRGDVSRLLECIDRFLARV